MLKKYIYSIILCFTFLSTAAFAEDSYEKDTVINDAADFFGEGAAGIGEVIEKIFKDQGKPNAIIKGEEASGA